MSRPDQGVPSAFLSLFVFRLLRRLTYRVIGIFRPGWKRAIPLLRYIERFSDQATMNIGLYSMYEYRVGIERLERELKRVRRGGVPSPDFLEEN